MQALNTACPCPLKGCYYECELEETCWIGSIADSLTDYKPIFTARTAAPSTAPSTAPSIVPSNVPTSTPSVDGCEVYNSNGGCDSCRDGFTLCGHYENGEGFCKETISDRYTLFRCGTGGEDTDYPSSDGYNYCGKYIKSNKTDEEVIKYF